MAGVNLGRLGMSTEFGDFVALNPGPESGAYPKVSNGGRLMSWWVLKNPWRCVRWAKFRPTFHVKVKHGPSWIMR